MATQEIDVVASSHLHAISDNGCHLRDADIVALIDGVHIPVPEKLLIRAESEQSQESDVVGSRLLHGGRFGAFSVNREWKHQAQGPGKWELAMKPANKFASLRSSFASSWRTWNNTFCRLD